MKFEGSLKEILDFVESTYPESSNELKLKIQGAMLSLADTTAMKAMITEIAQGVAEAQVRHALKQALIVTNNGGYGTPRTKELHGWLAPEMRELIRTVLADAALVNSIVKDIIVEEVKPALANYAQHADKTIAKVVADNVRSEQSAQYAEQVILRFKDMDLEKLIENVVQRVMGRMIANGQLRFTGGIE